MEIAYNSGNSAWHDHWKTITFTTLCIAQMGHALSCRSDSKLLTELNPISNPYLLISVIFTTILQLALPSPLSNPSLSFARCVSTADGVTRAERIVSMDFVMQQVSPI